MAMENTWVGVRLKPMPVSETACGHGGTEAEEGCDADVSAWSASAIDLKTLRYTGPMVETHHHHHHHHGTGTGVSGGQHHYHGQQQTEWRFDRVFGDGATNETVYKEAAAALVESALSGVNGTVFAYGQTSSGKTHTITSVVEQAAAHIFAHASKDAEAHEYCVTYSSLEIYNELVRDLLAGGAQLRVMEDAEGTSVVENLTAARVDSPDSLRRLIDRSSQTRAVAEHALNKASSRSHHITRFTIERRERRAEANKIAKGEGQTDEHGAHGAKTDTGKARNGGGAVIAQLNLVDLAGSERHKVTATSGTTLREGCHINRSLLVLTKVIRALGERDKEVSHGAGDGQHLHIPFRESKLTRLLQNSLGGNARCAIICTAAQDLQHVEHTRATLSFASRATAVATSATVNVIERSALQGMGGSELLTRYRDEVGLLKRQLEEIKDNPESLESFKQVRDELRREARRRESAEKSVKGYDMLLRASRGTPVRVLQQQQQASLPSMQCQHHAGSTLVSPSPCAGATDTTTPLSTAKLRFSWSPTAATDDDIIAVPSLFSPLRRAGDAVLAAPNDGRVHRSSLVRLSWDAGAGAGETTTTKLDLLAPSCRLRLRRLTERLFTGTDAGVEHLIGKMTALNKLSAAMGTEVNRRAMEALREEVRCMNVKGACVDASERSADVASVGKEEEDGARVMTSAVEADTRIVDGALEQVRGGGDTLQRRRTKDTSRRGTDDAGASEDDLVERLRRELQRMQAELSAEINSSSSAAAKVNAADNNSKLETINALRNEVERLTRDREAERRALEAITALEMRIEGMYGGSRRDTTSTKEVPATTNACLDAQVPRHMSSTGDGEDMGKENARMESGLKMGQTHDGTAVMVCVEPEEEVDDIVIVASPVPSPRMKDIGGRSTGTTSPVVGRRNVLGDANEGPRSHDDALTASAIDHKSVFCEVRSPSSSPLLQSPCTSPNNTLTVDGVNSSPRGFGVSPSRLDRARPNAAACSHADASAGGNEGCDDTKSRAYASAKRELLNLQSCLSHNRETIERLDCQKKLLLQQVLKLEFAVEDATRDRDASKRQLERLKKETDGFMRERNREASERRGLHSDRKSAGASGTAATAAAISPKDRARSMSEVVDLWHALNVPLRHRSLFLLSAEQAMRAAVPAAPSAATAATTAATAAGRIDDNNVDDLIAFELMRLRWLARRKLAPHEVSDAPAAPAVTCLALPEAARRKRLEMERRDLARRMKRKLATADIDAYLASFEIDPHSKKRKHQLTSILWAAGQDTALQRRDAELVHRLLSGDRGDGVGELPALPRLDDIVFGSDM